MNSFGLAQKRMETTEKTGKTGDGMTEITPGMRKGTEEANRRNSSWDCGTKTARIPLL